MPPRKQTKPAARAARTRAAAPPAVAPEPAAPEPTDPGVDLDSLFRKQSKARVVAERLLTGRPMTRAQLAEGLDLSLTTVPRVVDALTEAGVHVNRTTDRTRQAVYHVVGSPADKVVDADHGPVIARYVHASGDLRARITKVEIDDGRVWVEYTASRNGRRFRASVTDSGDGALSIPASLLSGEARLVAIAVFDDGELGFRFGDDRSSVLLSNHAEMR